MTFDPNSNISRWVAFFLLPLCSAAALVIATKAKQWFGIELNTGEVVAFLFAVAGGIITWLFNRGRYEAAHVLKQKPSEIEAALKLLDAKLPAPPTAPDPGHGSPSSPHAPGRHEPSAGRP